MNKKRYNDLVKPLLSDYGDDNVNVQKVTFVPVYTRSLPPMNFRRLTTKKLPKGGG
jgi:hypothetical protein